MRFCPLQVPGSRLTHPPLARAVDLVAMGHDPSTKVMLQECQKIDSSIDLSSLDEVTKVL